MEGIELKGCLSRIRNCVLDLSSLEEVIASEEDESWDLIERELQIKSLFLYFDLNRVISKSNHDQKKLLTKLVNKFFSFMDELDKAVKSKSVCMTQVCYNDTAEVLQQILTALAPPHSSTGLNY